jgi:hypothetical protein
MKGRDKAVKEKGKNRDSLQVVESAKNKSEFDFCNY